MVIAIAAAASYADVPPPKESEGVTAADVGFIFRGALFIFSSAVATMWLGRKLFKHKSK